MSTQIQISPAIAPNPLAAFDVEIERNPWYDLENMLQEPLNSASVFSVLGDRTLSLFQKILLTTDGTVTHLISLYTKETIKVHKVEQKIVMSGVPEKFLCSLNTPILKRSVLLQGREKSFLYAESIFIFENLSRATQYGLLESDSPIGLLWREEKLETNRQIIGYKSGLCSSSAYFNVSPRTPMLARYYYIYANGSLLGVIMEKFPSSFFKDSH